MPWLSFCDEEGEKTTQHEQGDQSLIEEKEASETFIQHMMQEITNPVLNQESKEGVQETHPFIQRLCTSLWREKLNQTQAIQDHSRAPTLDMLVTLLLAHNVWLTCTLFSCYRLSWRQSECVSLSSVIVKVPWIDMIQNVFRFTLYHSKSLSPLVLKVLYSCCSRWLCSFLAQFINSVTPTPLLCFRTLSLRVIRKQGSSTQDCRKSGLKVKAGVDDLSLKEIFERPKSFWHKHFSCILSQTRLVGQLNFHWSSKERHGNDKL